MRYKNYKSAIHIFADSFISLDYTKSGRLAINVLIHLYHMGIETKAVFDFMNKTVKPNEADTDSSRVLMMDYIQWLPEHFENHNCNLDKLEKLEITVWTDFDRAFIPSGMSDCKEFVLFASAKWKADGRDEQMIELSQTVIMKHTFLKSGIPELK